MEVKYKTVRFWKINNETKFKALEKEGPDEMEMAEKAHEEREAKKAEEVNFLFQAFYDIFVIYLSNPIIWLRSKCRLAIQSFLMWEAWRRQ
jgi:hypothetical protein